MRSGSTKIQGMISDTTGGAGNLMSSRSYSGAGFTTMYLTDFTDVNLNIVVATRRFYGFPLRCLVR